MKRLIPVFVVILATLGACSHQDAVRPDAPGDVIFNMSGGSTGPAGNGSTNEVARNEAIEAQPEAERLKNELLADKPAPEDHPQSTFIQELDSAYNQLKAEIDRKKAALQVLSDQKESVCAAGHAFDQDKCDALTIKVDQEKQALLAFVQQNLTGFIEVCTVKIAELDQSIAALAAGSPERVALEQEKAAVAALKEGYEAELAALQ